MSSDADGGAPNQPSLPNAGPVTKDAFNNKGIIIENVVGADGGIDYVVRLTPDSLLTQETAKELLIKNNITVKTLLYGPATGRLAVDLDGARAVVAGGGRRIIPEHLKLVLVDINQLYFVKTPGKNSMRLYNANPIYRATVINLLGALGIPHLDDPFVTVTGTENVFCMMTSGTNLSKSRNDFSANPANKDWVTRYIQLNGTDSNLYNKKNPGHDR